MMARMLAPLAPGFRYKTYPLVEGAPFPAVSSIDGAIITGSPYGVYEDHEWLGPLEGFIRDMAAAGKPNVGVCFGHQAMAKAFGGHVVKSDKGWGAGVHDYEVRREEDWMRPAARRLSCVVSHQDQVVAPPLGARVIAGSDFTPYGALAYAQGPAISFQMHPEFDADFSAALFRAREGRMPAETVEAALESLAKPTDRRLIAEWIVNFYHLSGRLS
ncbi:MAG: type 1 glutamine amidotransferase [Alphaproteobacteria bacterium]|nr:type 1 glutamine amidotransferase [Alphaproteobacteria bacterium]